MEFDRMELRKLTFVSYANILPIYILKSNTILFIFLIDIFNINNILQPYEFYMEENQKSINF